MATLRGSGEVVMAGRRRLDFCCLQETRWKGNGANCVRVLGEEGSRYKLFWVGCKEGVAGVGVLVAERWIDSAVQVKRVSERLMVARVTVGELVLNVISVYSPHVGRTLDEKMDSYAALDKVLTEVGSAERLMVCGDFNVHVGESIDGFERVHGGSGFGARNLKGEVLLDFADSHSLTLSHH